MCTHFQLRSAPRPGVDRTQGPVTVKALATSAGSTVPLYAGQFASASGRFLTAQWTPQHFSVITDRDSSFTLSITGLSRRPYNSAFIGLDAVDVSPVPVSQPSSHALLAAGIAAIGLRIKRPTPQQK